MKLYTDNKRIFGLDVIRAIAIIIVVIEHGGFILNGTIFEDFPFFSMIDGVDMFFVLSGFLIGGILLKELNKYGKFKLNQLLTFWKRRWFRTLPNYYLILLLNYFVVKYGIINEDINQFNFNFLTFTQNFSSPFFGFFWESWSLSIEEWFYILTPILIIVISKFTSIKKTFLISTIIMILMPILYRVYILNENINSFWYGVTFRKVVLCRLDSIGFGLFAAWGYYYHRNIWKKYNVLLFIIGVILMIFIINFDAPPNSFYKQIVYFSILPISILLVLPLAENFKKANGLLAYSIQHISKISYSMYLINLALVSEIIRDNFSPEGGYDSIFKYFIYWAIIITMSSLLYKYFEKPVMNLRDKKFKEFYLKKEV
jgi:peptidoglycan/LPS O-acetylase OafA/YrhL